MTEHKLMVSDADIDMARMLTQLDREAGRQTDPAILRIANAQPLPTDTQDEPSNDLDLDIIVWHTDEDTVPGSPAPVIELKGPVKVFGKLPDNLRIVSADRKPRRMRNIAQLRRTLASLSERRAAALTRYREKS